jgi:WD40 repeat protein
VRSSHGRNAKGSKITGIETITFPPDDPNGEVKLLITSNDSRVRMYNARDKSLEMKFKGYENTCSQIHATFSDDAKYVISGSEDRRVYIWNVGLGETEKKAKRPVEYFDGKASALVWYDGTAIKMSCSPSRNRDGWYHGSYKDTTATWRFG